jgi:hypothetical protein
VIIAHSITKISIVTCLHPHLTSSIAPLDWNHETKDTRCQRLTSPDRNPVLPMFSKSSANNNNNTSYAFSQPAAVNSSTAVRKQENDTFYNPLPAPRSSQDQSRAQPSVTGQSANPFTDPRRDYVSRTPSPHASNPLLSSQLSDSSSPSSSQFHNSSNMPSASRYAPRAGTGMPQRGESQSALLGGNGQVSSRSHVLFRGLHSPFSDPRITLPIDLCFERLDYRLHDLKDRQSDLQLGP